MLLLLLARKKRVDELRETSRDITRRGPRVHERIELAREIGRRWITMLTIAFERSLGDASKLFGDLGRDGSGIRNRTELHGAHSVEIRITTEQSSPGEKLPKRGAEREDVAASIERHLHDLFGREIRELAREKMRAGCFTGRRLRETKVEELYLAVERREDVGGIDIAMHEAERLSARFIGELVSIVKRVGHTCSRPRGDLGIESNITRDDGIVDRGEGLAEHELHRDEVLLSVTTNFERANDVRMNEPRNETAFLQKHLEHLLVPNIVTNDLERDDRRNVGEVLARSDLASEIDGAHSTARDFGDDLPLTKTRRTERPARPRRGMRHGFLILQ
jgi:hypothetical protein